MLLLCLYSSNLTAGEILRSEVRREGDNFLIQLEMQIEAPRDRVYQLLTDYDHLQQLSETIVKSRRLSGQGEQTRVEIITEGCVLFYCRTIRQVQTATELGRGYLKLIDDEQQSDFQYGRTLWHITAENNGLTRVTLSADMQPRFWVPPIIGTTLFRHKLLKESAALINNLEQRANHEP